ncbi:hypothetical protein NQ315_010611 [Exocentrus adspersus]|uniref:Delta(14)-sterol reductase n=1 Tax=Exocentrus adspersus TaxID=1586481 RepID=A0AAV8W751_9CUCU|nr:hypothetical protein NQ315_010611 [Exocentrus adspersus]
MQTVYWKKIEKPKAMVRGRSRKKEDVDNKGDVKTVDTDKDTNSFGVVQRFTRASQNREIERVVHLKHFDSVTVTKRLGEFSDEDDLVQKSQAEIQEFTDTKKLSEFGGSYGALFFMITFPVYVVALNIFCNEEQCSFTKLPNLQKFKSVSSFFNATSLLLLLAYVTLLAILTALPFGGTKVPALPNKHGKFYYVNNGFFSFVILTLIICGLEWRNISISTFIIDHILHLAVSSVLFGFVISVYAYIRSFYVPVSALNAHVVGKSGIYGFFLGREVNPRLFSIIDLKMMFFKGCVLAAVFIDYAYLYNSIKNTVTEKESENYPFIKLISSHPTLFTYTLLHSVHILEALVFESRWITTFEIEQEAFGFMLAMGYTVYPFITALIPKYLVNHGVELASWKLVADAVAFFLGYALYRLSNNQKDAFRKNPYSPSLSHLGTIPTMQGKKLLVSGFWGFVRHPNYLGDIMMHLCYIPFVGLTPPIVYPLCMILMLVHRSVRDNARCKLKYGAAWDRYCNRVKYVLIPKIY